MEKRKKSRPQSTSSSASKASAKASQVDGASSLFGFSLKGWTASAVKTSTPREAKSGAQGTVFVISEPQANRALVGIKKQFGLFPKWQEDQLKTWLEAKSGANDVFSVVAKEGPIWFVRLVELAKSDSANEPRDTLAKSVFARARDAAGPVLQAARTAKVEKLVLNFVQSTREELQGFLVGLEIANYSFSEVRGYRAGMKRPSLVLLPPPVTEDLKELKSLIADTSRLGVAVNLARHLTNLPGGTLTPTVYADLARAVMSDLPDVRVDVWDERRLKAENMNLLLAVGMAAAAPPRLVHISYRPKDRGAEKRPIALVGKGVTFDSGGLDIKPSSGMRLMKKDMGGSAAVLALTWWAANARLPLALDSYLALAENAISANSFRPGDIVKARNGLAIEIHNTDAEGRLVLADAMNVAVSQKDDDAPACMIDLATLTGAIKVGLGGEIAGLFTNNDDLAREIFDAGLKRGDLSWRMPLFQPYRSMLKSNFADFVNAGDGFGGAITAALFLELFTKRADGKPLPWAHLDIYAWKDSASGAWCEQGGSGQGVMSLSEVLSRFVSGKWAEG
jgi:leucyl aminopeptidase